MVLSLEKLPVEIKEWLDLRARSRGTSVDAEAIALLDDAVHDRIRRARFFDAATSARIRLAGPPLTEAEIEEAINWGRA